MCQMNCKSVSSTFSYDKDDTAKMFPIDYSIREFSQGMKGGPRAVRENLLAHPLVNGILLHVLNMNVAKSSTHREAPIPPIPLEATLFLEKFYRLARSSSFQKKLDHHLKEINPDDMKEFFNKLSQTLCDELTIPPFNSNQDPHAFCRHVLFNDPTFQKSVFDCLWSRHVMLRYQQLQTMAKTMTFEDQIYALIVCLQGMDSTILKLQNIQGTERFPFDDYQAAFQNLLQQLLTFRKIDSNRLKQGYISYIVDNIRLDDSMYMCEAFKHLKYQKSKNDQLMVRTRNAYLKHLAEQVPISSFEARYPKLQEYLDFTSHQLKEQELSFLITDCCKRYCLEVIDRCTITVDFDGPTLSGSSSLPNYVIDLIYNEAKIRMQTILDIFSDMIRLVCHYQSISYFYRIDSFRQKCILSEKQLEDNLLDKSLRVPQGTQSASYKEAVSFSKHLQCTWIFLYKSESDYNVSLFDENTYQLLHPDFVIETLYKKSKQAAQFFDRNELFPYSLEDIQNKFAIYDCAVTNPHLMISLGLLSNAISPLLMGCFLQVLKKAVEDSRASLLQSFQFLLSELSHSYTNT